MAEVASRPVGTTTAGADERENPGEPVYRVSAEDSVIDVSELFVEFPTALGVVRAL